TGRVQAYNFSGGLVGNNDGTISACYATGRVQNGGGLAGRNSGTISVSYSTGQVTSLSLPADALVYQHHGIIDFSYFDSRTTLWFFTSQRSVHEKTTEQLQEPTGYTGLYQLWNVDLDGDNSPDDPWHFGTTSQYPVLKADLDGSGGATWQEFGYQIREGPTLSATTALRGGETQVDLSWTSVNTGHWNPAPSVTYTLRRDTYAFYQLRNIAEGLNALSYTDTVAPSYRDFNSNRYAYQVAAVVSGGEATHSVPTFLQPDTQAPSVREIRLSGGPVGTAYAEGDEIRVTVSFSENLTVTGEPRLTLELGGGQRTAIVKSRSGLFSLNFYYTVASGDMDTNGVSVPAGRIDLSGGTIEDEAGNPALLDYPGVEPSLSHKVDGVKPMLLGAAVNQVLLVLTYDEGLGSSAPDKDDFTVEVGGVERSVSSVAVNGGVVELTLETAVGSGDTGITVSYSQGSNPIQDLVGNQADDLNDQSVDNTTGASNTAPEVTSSADFTTSENGTERWRLTATDSDDGDEVTGWAISGGVDRSRFWIEEVTGDFGFSQPPDYETPLDQASPAGDNEYVVMVRVTSGAGSRAMTAQQEIRVTVEDEDEPPGVPQTPFISERTLDGLKVEWTAPDSRGSGISGYVVQYRKADSGSFTEVQAGTGLSWTLTGLEEDTIYAVQVQATNHEGSGPWSESVRGRTDAPLTVEIASLEASPVDGPFTLRIVFSETVTGFDSNDIQIQVETDCRDSRNNPLYCIPGRGALRYPDGAGAFSGPTFGLTLTPRTDEVAGNYTLGIRIPAGSVQTSGGDHSNREATLQMRVLTPGATAPEPISSLDLKASPGTRSVKLSWSLPSDNGGSAIVRYEYRYAAVGEGLGLWKSAGAEALGVTVGNLAGGREHVFEVRAVNGLGKGPIETVMATPLAGGGFGGGGGGGGGLLFPPEAPTALKATAGDGVVRLEWSPPENDGGSPIRRYEYHLREGRGEFSEWIPIPDSAVDEVNAAGFTIGDLLNGTVYAFELRAVNAAGNGRVSEAVEVTMPLDPAYGSNFRAEDLEGVELVLEAFLLEGSSRDRQLRFGKGLRFEEDELDGEGEVTATEMGSYGYRYTSRTTGDLG
ncbi:MAG: fibronectin type III domain-containing protein, partial [Candidatus Aminicenantes bacterium]|nr:fibronectin type III domain-containing protein [Candidatus Aminicenantes bacterium]